MARWILGDLKAPQLKTHLKANWNLVKARERLKGSPMAKNSMIELLIPVLAQRIVEDRAKS